MKNYMVTFEKHGIYHSNVAIGEDADTVKNHYRNFNVIDIHEVTESEVEEAERKHMPFIEC